MVVQAQQMPHSQEAATVAHRFRHVNLEGIGNYQSDGGGCTGSIWRQVNMAMEAMEVAGTTTTTVAMEAVGMLVEEAMVEGDLEDMEAAGVVTQEIQDSFVSSAMIPIIAPLIAQCVVATATAMSAMPRITWPLNALIAPKFLPATAPTAATIPASG